MVRPESSTIVRGVHLRVSVIAWESCSGKSSLWFEKSILFILINLFHQSEKLKCKLVPLHMFVQEERWFYIRFRRFDIHLDFTKTLFFSIDYQVIWLRQVINFFTRNGVLNVKTSYWYTLHMHSPWERHSIRPQKHHIFKF